MLSSGMLHNVALVRMDVLEDRIASIIRVTVFLHSVPQLLVSANVLSSPILVTLMMEGYVPPKHWFSQKPHRVTPQKTAFFIPEEYEQIKI
jgi:hypothetical protein